MTTTKLFIASFIGCLTLISCDKKENLENDSVAPTVSNVRINGLSEIPFANASDTLQVSASFSDDKELGKLDIIVEGKTPGSNWSERKYVNLSGSSQNVNETFVILPNVKEGMYTVSLDFTDARGNKSNHSIEPFQVFNTSIPEMVGFKAEFDNGYDYQTGDTLRIFGQAIDDEDLKIVAIRIKIPLGYSGNQIFYEEQFKLGDFDDKSWDFQSDGDVKVYFPKYSKTGGYTLEISVIDNVNNIFASSTIITI